MVEVIIFGLIAVISMGCYSLTQRIKALEEGLKFEVTRKAFQEEALKELQDKNAAYANIQEHTEELRDSLLKAGEDTIRALGTRIIEDQGARFEQVMKDATDSLLQAHKENKEDFQRLARATCYEVGQEVGKTLVKQYNEILDKTVENVAKQFGGR